MGVGWIQSEVPGVCLQDKSMTGNPGRSQINRGKEQEQSPSRKEGGGGIQAQGEFGRGPGTDIPSSPRVRCKVRGLLWPTCKGAPGLTRENIS